MFSAIVATRSLFLATLAETGEETDCQVQSFCLNHFHLFILQPKGSHE